MIPRKLELKNFLSYGDVLQTIDLTPYSMICLSGKNGNGKSAFLDAITWAIWGQARKTSGTSKADEGLLHLGKTRMLVSLEWELGGKIYRVRREYAKTYGKPYAALDFELYNAADDKYISLTDKTIRQTQEVIEKTVGIDFDTFINSAFIKQGQSNEFSKKTPKERKTILANILGLARYDRLQQAALAKARSIDQKKQILAQVVAHHEQELAQEPELTNNRTSLQESIAQCEQQATQHTTTIATFLVQQKTSESLCVRYQVIAEQQHSLQQTMLLKQADLHEQVASWRATHAQSLSTMNPKLVAEERQTLVNKEKEYRLKQDQSLTVERALLAGQKKLHERLTSLQKLEQVTMQTLDNAYEKNNLLKSQALTTFAQQQRTSAAAEQELATTKKRLASLNEHLVTYPAFAEEFQKIQLQFDKRKQFYHTLVQRGNALTTQHKELAHKQGMAHNQNNPACPLCEQMLTAQRKKFLTQQLSKQEQQLRHRLARITLLIGKLKQLLVEQHKTLEEATKQDNAFKQSSVMVQELERVLIQQTATSSTLATALKEHEQLIITLTAEQEQLALQRASAQKTASATRENDELIVQITHELTTLEEQKKLLTYIPEDYVHLQKRITELDVLVLTQASLNAALEQQPHRKKNIQLLIRDLRLLKKQAADAVNDLEHYRILSAQLITLQQAVDAEQKALAACMKTKEALINNLGICESQIARLTTLALEVTNKKKEIEGCNAEIQHYQTLSTAFSKNGIQALLIEEAIPEIEQEANTLLAQLTDNQSQLFIESLRDLKSGGVRETLDIKIADTAGIRPYEMFSGGEAFRVDFALRIAIAKLLARRAGTALQTLIIDEGFGSQDDEGLARIMTALYAIQKDFAKIIIVSHLTEFKENFPVHFLVEKTPMGSSITVEERG